MPGANTPIDRLDSIPAATLDKIISGADNQLPKVTSTDNGKILVVDGGKWGKGENSGGGGAFIVNATTEGSTMTLAKTWKEIDDVILTTPVFVVANETEGGISSKSSIPVVSTSGEVGLYTVITYNEFSFTTDSENGYPSYTVNV